MDTRQKPVGFLYLRLRRRFPECIPLVSQLAASCCGLLHVNGTRRVLSVQITSVGHSVFLAFNHCFQPLTFYTAGFFHPVCFVLLILDVWVQLIEREV